MPTPPTTRAGKSELRQEWLDYFLGQEFWDRSRDDVATMASELGIGPEAAMGYLRQENIKVPTSGDFKRRDAANALKKHKVDERTASAIRVIAKEYGIAETTVRRSAGEFKVKLPKPQRHYIRFSQSSSLEVIARLIAREKTQETLEEIGADFDLSRQRVKQIEQQARKAGIFKAIEFTRKGWLKLG